MPSADDWAAVGAIGQWAGAVATTAAVVVALSAERRARSTKIVLSVTYGATGAKMKGGPAFAITAVNHSNRSVILDGSGILLPDGRLLGQIATQSFTDEIKPLERREHAFPTETVARWMIDGGIVKPTRLTFYIKDTTGKQHKYAYKFDPSPWLVQPKSSS